MIKNIKRIYYLLLVFIFGISFSGETFAQVITNENANKRPTATSCVNPQTGNVSYHYICNPGNGNCTSTPCSH